MIYAVDFDGTIVEDAFPDIGNPREDIIKQLKILQKNNILILWTCRVDNKLKEAVEYCRNIGLNFKYINENVPERKVLYNNDCRKIGADYYIDDRAIRPEEINKLLKGNLK